AINNENVASAQEDLRLAEERYRIGAGTLLDIINAQVNVTRSRSTLVRTKYDSMIALAQLQAIMGTLGK
ncbi:MAG: TolC family protein, partial [bacterium]